MQHSFLEKVSDHIFKNYQSSISELSIVLPNKRAGLFLKKNLAAKFKKNIWAPQIYSIDEFMIELSGMVVAEPMTILFELYTIYQKTEGANARPFEEFIRWAPVLINDFNEIDSYYADSDELFNYLNEIRAIELWNPSGRELSGVQSQYLSFWKSLGNLYRQFSAFLKQKKHVYQGLAYRIAAEKVQSNLQDGNEKIGGPLLFVGFNALTKAEEMVIQQFIFRGKTEILWDGDQYYFENKNQEAGKFLRKYLNSQTLQNEKGKSGIHFSPFAGNINGEIVLPLGKDLVEHPKEIEIIGTSGNIAQAKIAGEILSSLYDPKNSLSENSDFLNTAVVLSDESLLIPVLNSIPEKVEKINITMGYPLKNTPLHDFWNAAFQLHENIRISSGNRYFYHKNIIQILSHPFLAYPGEMAGFFYKIISEIKQKNRIYLSREELEKIAEPFGKKEEFKQIQSLFSDWKNNPMIAIETAIYFIKRKIGEKNMEAEFLSRYLEIFHQVQSLEKQYQVITDLRTLRIIFNQLVGGYTAPFSGEPLNGLQIMGMLETRTLDFETVILLSANEDILPSGKKQNSFIPLDLKKQFGLPTYNDRDAIFAYHFYRLLQRAKKVFLLYNNDISKSSGMGGSEKSRFIAQIKEELPRVNPGIKITEKIHSFSTIQKNEINLNIIKNEQIFIRLNEISNRGFSPTAINTFLNCPLDFYYKYIVGLREGQEVEETIEAAVFGDFVHEALQNLYIPFVGKIISAGDLEQRKKDCEEITKTAFLSKYSERDLSFGKNLLALKVAEKLIGTLLKQEIDFLKKLELNGEFLTLLDLEKELETKIFIDDKPVKIKGKADRIDMMGQTIRIIDYKTGNVFPADLKIENIEITSFEKQKPKAVQLLMYAMIYSKHTNSLQYKSGVKNNFLTLLERGMGSEMISPGIISMRKLSEGFLPLTIAGSEAIENNSLVDFEKELGKIIADMYNPVLPFAHSHESKYCEYCKG